MYATIIYISSIAARQFNLNFYAEASLTGLFAHVLYGVYDINGPPNLWWTWHDADPAISVRQQNAPIGSSMWILTYISVHQFLMRCVELPIQDTHIRHIIYLMSSFMKNRFPFLFKLVFDTFDLGGKAIFLARFQQFFSSTSWIVRIATLGLVCTPVFMAIMGIFQILSFDKIGIPGKRTYRFALACFVATVAIGVKHAADSDSLLETKLKSNSLMNRILLFAVFVFYLINMAINAISDSTKHMSTGCHQPYGASKTAVDIMLYEREDHLDDRGPCKYSSADYSFANPKEDGNLDPVTGIKIIYPKRNGPDSEWYTIKGAPRADWEGDSNLLHLMSAIGLLSYTLALG